jgi:nuclear pore complex protein Nup188
MGWTCLLTRIHQDVQYALHWDDGVEAPARGPPVVELYNSLLPDLFPTTVEVGLKQLSSLTTRQMLEAVVLLLDPAQRSSDTTFCLWWEEDGLRMKNVVADLMRQTLGFFEFHSALIVAMHLAHDVEYSKIPAFNKFLEQEAQLENEQPSYTWIGSPAKKFLQDDGAMKLLERAKNRFPHEPLPFLRLLRCLATQPAPVVEYLTHLPTCTQALPQYFGGLEDVEPEDEDAPRRVILTTELVLFPPRQSGMFECEVDGQTGTSGGIFIPPGTEGVYLADGTRPVIAWRCEYNALALLGRILECAASGETGVGPDLVNKEVVTEIVSLLTTLVTSSPEARAAEAREPGHYEPPQVLAEASELMNRTRDVVSVVFDLLDSALNSYTVQNPFFVVGLEFVTSLVHVAPGRVWPYLARSVLLERNGRGGAFSGYLSSVEVTQGSYDFTLACLTLYEKLVEEAIRGSAAQRGSTKSLILASKSAPQGPGGVGVSDMVQREILVGFTRAVVDILESYRSFKYAKDIAQKLLIGAKITSVFTQSLYYVYGVDDISDPAHKITGVLVPSAEYLVAVFLSASDSDLPIEPISGGITDGVQTPESSLYLQTLGLWKEQVIQIVRFADMLVRVRLYLG